MSNDDELMAHGRMLVEYGETKKRLVALRAEGRRMRSLVHALTADLETTATAPTTVVTGDLFKATYRDYASGNCEGRWPTFEEVNKLRSDIKSTRERLVELRGQLKAIGVPIDEREEPR